MHRVLSIPITCFQSWFGAGPIWRRPFIRNAAVLVGGTAAAQAITVAFSPVITRLYGPDAFGILGVFTSVISILTPIAALCYSYAVVLPPEDGDGLRLVRLSAHIAAGMAVLVAVIIIPLRGWIAALLGLDSVAPYLLLVPIVVFLAAVGQTFDQWLIRKKLFRTSSGIAVAQALIVNGGKTVLGLLAPGAAALIGVSSAGHGLHAVLSALGSRATRRRAGATVMGGVADAHTKALAREYSDFALYRTPQVLLNAISQNLPVVVLASLFGPAVAGLYGIGHRVLKLPAGIVSQAVGRVFQQRIAEAAHRRENLRRLLVRATVGLALVGVIPFGLVVVFGPSLFFLLFGSEWYTAGLYARWMSFWAFFMFINVPSMQSIPILYLQKHLLVFELLVTAIRVVSLVVPYLLAQTDVTTVAVYSLCGALLNLGFVLWVIHQSRATPRSDAR